MRFFIAVYTNRVKDYCDTEFFERLARISKGHPVMIVDNTIDDGDYTNRIETLTHNYPNFNINWIIVPREPKESQFQRNVTESVNLCRDAFLRTKADVFVIIESDVLPPVDLLDTLEKDIKDLEISQVQPWGILGGIYYKGFHDFNLTGLRPTNHVLSGCTAYTRSLIEKCPFRYDSKSLGPFPDAWMSVDACARGYGLWNDHDIVCEHIEINPGNRGHHKL